MLRFKSTQSLKLPSILLVFQIIVLGIILAVSSGNFIINVKETGFSVLSNTQNAFYSVISRITGTFSAIKELATLQKEYTLLKEKLEEYQYMQRTNVQIMEENKRLTELLEFTQTYRYKNIPVSIIARSSDNLYASITVNKGRHHGIKKNMSVIAVQSGVIGLVGKVVEVGMYTSLIMPIYDHRYYVSARIKHTSDLGIANGTGIVEHNLTMDYIKKRVSDKLHYGDLVVTSGENGNYIPEIAIGTIASISTVNYDTSLLISLEPILDFGRLKEVIIVDSQKQKDSN